MQTMTNEEIYLLAFHLADGIGPVKLGKILNRFGSFEEAYKYRNTISPRIPDLGYVKDYIVKLGEKGIKFITFLNPEFPKRLRDFQNLPKVIYYKGNLNVLNHKTVGIVGTRYPSVSAKNFVYKLSQALCENGFTVVSGGALGIDTAAHKGCINRTVVVMGCGLNGLYPRDNIPMFNEIVKKGGLILSEFPLGIPPNPGNFPARNRVISALSDVVVIGQSPAKSGAIITAKWALDQGKDIWAIPGDPEDLRNFGSNKLIYEGAKPLYDIGEFLAEIKEGNLIYNTPKPILNEYESDLLEFLREERHIDEIVENFGNRIYNILLELQVKGYITELPGKFFRSNL
ncbi:MAG: DNA-processing protein DprA [candidate division WOR-3 bacterium]